MRIIDATNEPAVARLVAGDRARDPRLLRRTARIVADVRARGDRAVAEWTTRTTGVTSTHEEPLGAAALEAGWASTPRDVRSAIRLAVRHVERVATRQVPRPFEVTVTPGVRIEQRVEALESVGCYVPGGRYPLASTLVMTAVPARVAGVGRVAVACPRPSPAVLCAALEAGVSEFFVMGGAQAIAAFAYGTRAVRRVNKIVGPGSAWVTAAKDIVSNDVAIDFHAGPSEIVVLAHRGRAAWIAADLIAQAEHDVDARAVLVTTSRRLAAAVVAAVAGQMPEDGAARVALRRHGAVVVAKSRAQAVEVVNRLAPEHLVCLDAADASRCRTAGTIFVGAWSAQASGDYCTGSNHVLPTGGAARTRGGLSAADFVRVFSVQTLGERGLRRIGPSVVALAEAEGLTAHAQSVQIRIGPGKGRR